MQRPLEVDVSRKRIGREVLSPRWIVCQVGAREHYSVARMLHAAGDLSALVTDIWSRPSPISAILPPQLRGRYDPELSEALVLTPGIWRMIAQAGRRSATGYRDSKLVKRNLLFQQNALPALGRVEVAGARTILFSYSYAAGSLFRFAKTRGWKTVLGQIDPGPKEEGIVRDLARQNPALVPEWAPAPPDFWTDWREEVRLADRIVVNSNWTNSALVEAGVPESKIRTIPLAYYEGGGQRDFVRTYPKAFSNERPLRVLFLGQINVRKGAHLILDVSDKLKHMSIEFWFVGPEQIKRPSRVEGLTNIRWVGSVPRSSVANYYRSSDVLLFPTHSDGFGLVQLEAQSWGLPIIASRSCAEVVQDGINGRLLEALSSEAIADVLKTLHSDSAILARMSGQARIEKRFRPQSVAAALRELGDELTRELCPRTIVDVRHSVPRASLANVTDE